MAKGKPGKTHHDAGGGTHRRPASAEDLSEIDHPTTAATGEEVSSTSDPTHPTTHSNKGGPHRRDGGGHHDHHHINLFKKMSEYWKGSAILKDDTANPARIESPAKKDSPATSGMLVNMRGKVVKDLWKVCCNEVAAEREDCNRILASLGLPPYQFCKDKAYPLTDYDIAPDLETSKGKDFLDFYIFPVLLPGIQALLQYAKDSRVFQCKFHSFDPIDYIVHYLHNNNPRYPDRTANPRDLHDIPFVKTWLHRYPRRALAKWLTMPRDEAARIIQRHVRGFFARIRPDVLEMRQFWKLLRKEQFEAKLRTVQSWRKRGAKMTLYMAALTIQRAIRGFIIRKQPAIAEMRAGWKEKHEEEGFDLFNLDSLLDDEGDADGGGGGGAGVGGGGAGVGGDMDLTHSETCVICARLRELLKIEETKEPIHRPSVKTPQAVDKQGGV